MIDNLLGCDPREVTPQRAGATFSEFVHATCKDTGRPFSECWTKAKTLHPELFARMCNQDRGQAATVEAPPQSTAIPFAQKASILPSLKLPANTSDAVFSTAWMANGAQANKLNAQKVFMALVTTTAIDQKLGIQVARRTVKDTYPELTAAAGETIDA